MSPFPGNPLTSGPQFSIQNQSSSHACSKDDPQNHAVPLACPMQSLAQSKAVGIVDHPDRHSESFLKIFLEWFEAQGPEVGTANGSCFRIYKSRCTKPYCRIFQCKITHRINKIFQLFEKCLITGTLGFHPLFLDHIKRVFTRHDQFCFRPSQVNPDSMHLVSK